MITARILLAAAAAAASFGATPASAACVHVIVYGPVIRACAGDDGGNIACVPRNDPTVCVSL